METVLEQFIASDRPKRISNGFRNLAIGLAIVGLLMFMALNIVGIALEIAAAALFVASYFMYIDCLLYTYHGQPCMVNLECQFLMQVLFL